MVAVSSMEFGLFLLKPNFDAMAAVVAENAGLRDPDEGQIDVFFSIIYVRIQVAFVL